jgi:hypothetical protein
MATADLDNKHPFYINLLKELNKLRTLENRQQNTELPPWWTKLSQSQLLSITFRIKKEIEWHEQNKQANERIGLPYVNQIFLNETEKQLWIYNHRQIRLGHEQVQSLSSTLVDNDDHPLYFPDGNITDSSVFITDTDCRLINTPTYVQAQQMYRASHLITGQVTQSIKTAQTSIPEFENLPASTPFNLSRNIEGLNLEGLTLGTQKDTFQPYRQRTETILSLSENSLPTAQDNSDIEDPFIITGDTTIALGAIPKTKREKIETRKEQVTPPLIIPKPFIQPPRIGLTPQKPILRRPMFDPYKQEVPQKPAIPLIERRNVPKLPPLNIGAADDYRKLKMEEAIRKIQQLEQEKAALKADLQKSVIKPKVVKTERQEITDIQTQMNDMMAMIKMMTVSNQLNATTDTERKLVDKLHDTTYNETLTSTGFLIKLERPTNIIENSQLRIPETLPCLKTSAVINTVGTFDPDVQPDFRNIWDRILDQTRSFAVYEHEYVTCLRIVMKGTASNELDKMVKEYKGNLDQILEAIEDLYVPQHTIYDELLDLKTFSRKPNEHMRSVVRRANLMIGKLKHTVSENAWNDRKYTLLIQIIKQVIDKETWFNLRAEEIRCAQMGQTLSIEAIISIIDFFEVSKNLVPKQEIKLQYDVHSMRLFNQPDVHKDDIDTLKDEITSLKASILAPKRRKIETPSNKPSTPGVSGSLRKHLQPRRRLQVEKMDTSENKPPPNPNKRPLETISGQQYSYAPANTTANQSQPFRKPRFVQHPSQMAQNIKPITSTIKQPYEQRGRTPSTGRGYKNNYSSYYPNTYNNQRSKSPYRGRTQYNNYSRNRSQSPYRNKSQSPYRYNNNNRARKSYNFRGKRHDVALNFYKCSICPDAHEEGTTCNTIKALPYSPNE